MDLIIFSSPVIDLRLQFQKLLMTAVLLTKVMPVLVKELSLEFLVKVSTRNTVLPEYLIMLNNNLVSSCMDLRRHP